MRTIKLKNQKIGQPMQKELLTNYRAVFFAVFAQIIAQASNEGHDSSERVFDNLTTANCLIDKMPVNALQFVKSVIAYCLPPDSFSNADRQFALKKLQKIMPYVIFYC